MRELRVNSFSEYVNCETVQAKEICVPIPVASKYNSADVSNFDERRFIFYAGKRG